MSRNVLLVLALTLGNASTASAAETHVGVQVRPRAENSLAGNIQARPGGDSYRTTQRTRLTVSSRLDDAELHVEVQDVRTWASETNTVSDFSADGLDVHQAWAQIGDTLYLRVGRQEIVLDEQRLFGAVNWSQAGRAFDGLRLGWQKEDFLDLTLFVARVPDGGTHDMYLVRAFAPIGGLNLSIPIFFQTNAGVSDTDRGPRIEDWGLATGGLFVERKGQLSFRVEGYVQAGTLGEQDIMAFMAGTRAGYRVNDALSPVLWADFVSGDNDHTDTTIAAFDSPFGAAHKFYGTMDRFRKVTADTQGGGLIDIALKNKGKVGPGLLQTDLHYFMFASENRQGQAGAIGTELDLAYRLKIAEKAQLEIGAGLFVDMGDFSEKTDAAGNRVDKDKTVHDWFYVMVDIDTN